MYSALPQKVLWTRMLGKYLAEVPSQESALWTRKPSALEAKAVEGYVSLAERDPL